jgi:hypothetical protein
VKKHNTRGALSTVPAEPQVSATEGLDSAWNRVVGRRAFLKGVGVTGAAALVPAALTTSGTMAARRAALTGRRCDPAVSRRGRAHRDRSLAAVQRARRSRRRQCVISGCALEPRRRHAAVHRGSPDSRECVWCVVLLHVLCPFCSIDSVDLASSTSPLVARVLRGLRLVVAQSARAKGTVASPLAVSIRCRLIGVRRTRTTYARAVGLRRFVVPITSLV